MEKRLKVSDFATLVGIVPKTVYKMIERGEIMTVTEKVNNRNTTVIITSDEQIEEFKKNYGKSPVNEGNYYENLTDNDHTITYPNGNNMENYNNNNVITAEVIDRIISLNEGYNEQLKEVTEKLFSANDELVKVKSQTLLLEDKAGREGYYLNEINTLEKANNRLKSFIYLLFTVIVLLLIGLTFYVTYNVTVNNRTNTDSISVIEQKKAEQAQPIKSVKPVRKLNR